MYQWLRPLLFLMDPESAHKVAVRSIAHGLLPPQPRFNPPELKVKLWNKVFPNPVGFAAGFDKHGDCYHNLFAQGLGFVEIGGVTPKPQKGNQKPRLFRLSEDQAVINRMGLNSKGVEYCVNNLVNGGRPGIVGINIAPNKESNNWVTDYLDVFQAVHALVDYVSINISSPNTPGLRAMQTGDALYELIIALINERNRLQGHHGTPVPLLIKIAPDMEQGDLEAIAQTCMNVHIDGVIISNTTVMRPPLRSKLQHEQGGLSGRPLFERSTQVLREFYRLTHGSIPLIGVGGISSGHDAYIKIRAGASLVQLYSALIYQGFDLVTRIKRDLALLLERDGFKTLQDAIGFDSKK